MTNLLGQEAHDDIVRLAAFICGTPIAAVSVVDTETLRDTAFCAHTLQQTDLLIVPDALSDERFRAHPLVTGDPTIRFYAEAPLRRANGSALGSLRVIDRVPHILSQEQQAALRTLARSVTVHMETALREEEQHRKAEEKSARLAEYNRLILESTAEGIYGMDLQGRCTFINKAACQMLGYTPEEAAGQLMHALIHHSRSDGTHYPVEECPIYGAFQTGLPCHVDTEMLWRKDGTPFHSAYSSYPLSDSKTLLGAVVTFSDISERKRIEQEQEELLLEAQERADHDPLTNLLNHRAFHDRLWAETSRARRENTTLAVVMVDLDNFKFFNDVYGHTTGDEVLRLVACRLREVYRSYDTLARFGGDEFALLLPNIGASTHEDVEARLHEAFEGLFYRADTDSEAIPVCISLGAAVFSAASADQYDVLRQADERLLWSKTGGNIEEKARRIRADAGTRVEGFEMLDALVAAVDNKDRYTRRHSEDVMEYSLQIALELGLSEETRRTLGIAALLHDVGKIGVPDAVLRKPGRLTEQETLAVKQHPAMGAVMISSVPGLEDVLDAVRHHHERWDGGGYPFGLAGLETPLIARLMAVADAYSAMTTDRPYRKGMEPAKALRILEAGAGTQWDPACVSAFLRVQTAPQTASQRVQCLYEAVPN